LLDKVCSGTHAKPRDVLFSIRIDRARTDFFGSRNVRTGDNDFFNGDARAARRRRRRRCFLAKCDRGGKQENSCHASRYELGGWLLDYTSSREIFPGLAEYRERNKSNS